MSGGGYGGGAWGGAPYGYGSVIGGSADVPLSESLSIAEGLSVSIGLLKVEITGGRYITATPVTELRFHKIRDFQRYSLFTVVEGSTVLPRILSIDPVYTILESGSGGAVVNTGSSYSTRALQVDGPIAANDYYKYIEIENGPNTGRYQILSVLVPGNPGTVLLDRELVLRDAYSGALSWKLTTAVQAIEMEVTKVTNNVEYQLEVNHLWTDSGLVFSASGKFETAAAPKPQVASASALEDGVVLVTFNEPMRSENDLVDPADYEITGPTTVRVKRAWTLTDTKVALDTVGLDAGSYTLEVNTSGTPKDIAGNPLDPIFNQAIFTASASLAVRSIFTNKGPITKPIETLDSGTSAVLESSNEVTLPGASLTSSHVGKEVVLSGGSLNEGTFYVVSVISSTQAKLKACFNLPDPASGSIDWALIDSHHGEIADDPADVTVRVNSVSVTPEAVIGLLGQIVLNAAPSSTDPVEVDYSHICNPTVEIRRLNSKEFRLNAWNRNVGGVSYANHNYRYNNVLVTPSDYDPDNMLDTVDQPLQREIHYRAYERAYTPVLNDPNLLVLNAPIHRIAYPEASRSLSEVFVRYEALFVPDDPNLTYPWEKHGTGTGSIFAGVLTVDDDSGGEFPTGQPLFWTREVDLTYPLVFASSWRFYLETVTEAEGVFTGVASGFSDDKVSVIVGFLEDGGVKKVGLFKRGAVDPGDLTSWTGGLDSLGVPTGQPVEFDWSILHSYRLFRDLNGTVKLYVDGEIVESLSLTADELPFLEEIPSPFEELQGVFFGSVSRPARSVSKWDFVSYLVSPTNPQQTAPSSFVSYEANQLPEEASRPWTPVGYHGTGTILSTEYLLLEATSATDAASATEAGLVGGDFRGYLRMEPLLTQASEFTLDAQLSLLTLTHGVDPDGLMMSVDDGSRIMQLAFLSDVESPRKSYGGNALPGDFSPYVWSSMGSQTAEMIGRDLRITDASTTDGLVYYIEDTAPSVSVDRVVAETLDYILEARFKVQSYTVDGSGFAGAFAQVYDSKRAVGIMLTEVSGTKYVSLHADGVEIPSAQWAFDWGDGAYHTYRLRKSYSGDLVTLLVDGILVGTVPYSSFVSPGTDPVGLISWGSSTPASSASESVVDWAYCNAWRVLASQKRYVGLWKGPRTGTLADYTLPLKASGKGAQALTNRVQDTSVNFLTLGVVAGDYLIVDSGPNQGVYQIQTVFANYVEFASSLPLIPSEVDYRIPDETDWSVEHKYRLYKDSTGQITVLLDSATVPLFQADYGPLALPSSTEGLVHSVSGGLPSVVFGSFSSEHLEQSLWDFVRYGITLAPTEQRIAPHHMVLNQWNVMESPEVLRTTLPHDLTDFKSSSTGIVPKKDPDFLKDPGLTAFTLLNEDTPPVPLTQTYDTQAPYPTQEYVSALNRPEDVLNNDGDFTLNDGHIRFKLVVPDDILYNSLDLIEQTTGTESLIKPFCDNCSPNISGLKYQETVCLEYTGDTLPENDSAAPTPWTLVSDNPSQVSASASGGILTYGTGVLGTKTVYRNDTPLPDAPGLQSEATFRIRLKDDGTLGTGDSQVRFGISAPGLTVALAFVTESTGLRRVVVFDLNSGLPVGATTFDFLDGAYHTYRIVRDPSRAEVRIFIDS